MRLAQAVSALLAAALAAPGYSLEPPTPLTFSARTEIVSVNVTVMDKGRSVSDLGPESFSITEDFVSQTVLALERQLKPVDLILMVDVSASMQASSSPGSSNSILRVAQNAAKRFLKALRPDDRAMVIDFDTTPTRHRDADDDLFTGNRKHLESSIESLVVRKRSTSLYTSLYIVLKDIVARNYSVTDDQPRRPVIVMLTDGEDTSSTVTDAQVIAQAKSCGAAIYSIMLPPVESDGNAWQKSHDAEFFLDSLAKETGGSVQKLRTNDDLRAAYSMIALELQSQYRLEYRPTNDSLDGNWRTIQVAVSGKPDLTVRHRQGYYARPE
jgi:VWFA-related protein